MLIMGRNAEAINLYKALIRESQRFTSYNFRNYFLRRTREGFRNNKDLHDPQLIQSKLKEGSKNLDVLRRQAQISEMYRSQKLIIEQNNHKRKDAG